MYDRKQTVRTLDTKVAMINGYNTQIVILEAFDRRYEVWIYDPKSRMDPEIRLVDRDDDMVETMTEEEKQKIPGIVTVDDLYEDHLSQLDVPFELLEARNRKILDEAAERFKKKPQKP